MTRKRSPAAALINRIANRQVRISLLRRTPDPDLEAIAQLEAKIAELEAELDALEQGLPDRKEPTACRSSKT